MYSFETQLGLMDPELEPGRVEEKIGWKKTRCDPVRPDQKPSYNLLTFIFFIKTTSFWFFYKKKTWPTQ